METTKKKLKYLCPKCDKKFTTNRGLASHSRMHKPLPPPPAPKKTTEVAKCTPYSGSYVGARRKLDIGDVFYRIEKHVVNSLTITENSEDLQISSTITKSYWQPNKPE